MSIRLCSDANTSTSASNWSLGMPVSGFLILKLSVSFNFQLAGHSLSSGVLRHGSNASLALTLITHKDGAFALRRWGNHLECLLARELDLGESVDGHLKRKDLGSRRRRASVGPAEWQDTYVRNV